MYETEIKILGIERPKVEAVLISSGAEKVFDGEVHALYYDTRDRSLQAQKKILRLRNEGGTPVLAFKGHVCDSGAKIREETEVAVSDFAAMKTILESAGFSAWLEMKKHRTTYRLSGVIFEFDKYSEEYGFIPEFLEIEGPDAESLYLAAEMLGFKKEDCLPWDALQVAEYYRGRIRTGTDGR